MLEHRAHDSQATLGALPWKCLHEHEMRAARAARGGAQDPHSDNRCTRRTSWRHTSPEHATSSKRPAKSPTGREATRRAEKVKQRRTRRSTVKRQSRPHAKQTVEDGRRGLQACDKAQESRFPVPYPGVNSGRPPSAAALYPDVQGWCPTHGGRSARAGQQHPGSQGGVTDHIQRPATVVKRRKRPRSANMTATQAAVNPPMVPRPSLPDRTLRDGVAQWEKPQARPTQDATSQITRVSWGPPRASAGARRDSGSERLNLRPTSAPSRRGIDRDDGRSVMAALSRLANDSCSSSDELRIMKWVLLRETYIVKLRGLVSNNSRRPASASRSSKKSMSSTTARGRSRLLALLTELLTVLRRITVEIVEAIERWRKGTKDKSFIWGSWNYLLKAAGDTSFLASLPGLEQHLGVSVADNPFFCHVALDGRPAFPPPRAPMDGQDRDGGRKAANMVPLSDINALGVSPERVEAATAVLYREVLRARGRQDAHRASEPKRRSRLSQRRLGERSWVTLPKCGECTDDTQDPGTPLQPREELQSEVLAFDGRVSENQTAVVDNAHVVAGCGRRSDHRKGENVDDPYAHDGVRPQAEDGLAFGQHEWSQKEDTFRRQSTHSQALISTTAHDSWPIPYENRADGRHKLSDWSGHGVRKASGDRSSERLNDAGSGADLLASPSTNHHRRRDDFGERPADQIIVNPPFGMGDLLAPQAVAESGHIDRSLCAAVGREESPFSSVFNMCDDMLTNLKGMGDGSAVEAPTLGALSEYDEYLSSVRNNQHESQPTAVVQPHAGGTLTRGEPIDVERPPETSEGARSPRGSAYERLTHSFCRTTTETEPVQLSSRKWRREDDEEDEQSEGSCLSRVARKASRETLSTTFGAWAGATQERLWHRDAGTEKFHNRFMLRRAMIAWDAHRSKVLAVRMAEAFAGQFGLSDRFFVRFAFAALRTHARGTKVAARNRSTMVKAAMRLESTGRARLRTAWHRWIRAMGRWDSRCHHFVVRMSQLWTKARLSEAFHAWRLAIEAGYTRSVAVLKGKLTESLAESFASGASAALKWRQATATASGRQDSKPTSRKARKDSWDRWLGEDLSVRSAPAGYGEEQGQQREGEQQQEGGLPERLVRREEAKEAERPSSPGPLRGLGARLLTIASFRDVKDGVHHIQRERQRSPTPSEANLVRSKRPNDVGGSEGVVSIIDLERSDGAGHEARVRMKAGGGASAANMIQGAWRASRERRVAARVALSAVLIQRTWRMRCRRRRAGRTAVRAWRARKSLRDRTLQQALVQAASEGDLRVVAFLLRPAAGGVPRVDVNTRGSDGSTALHAASGRGRLNSAIRDVALPGTRDGLVNAKDNQDRLVMERPCADWAGTIRALAEAAACLEAENADGLTPMMSAAAAGDRHVVEALAVRGAEVNAVERGEGLRTPLVIAAQEANTAAAAALLEFGARVNAPAGDGLTPLHEAVGAGSIDVAEMLVRAGADVNAAGDSAKMTPLHLAIENDQHKAARLLVHSGADVCLPDARGLTPLRLAVEMGDVRTAALLLQAEPPADLTLEDEHKGTMLHAACRLGSTDMARLLLGAGADLHARDARGKTPELVALDSDHVDCAGLFYNLDIRTHVPRQSSQGVAATSAFERTRSHETLARKSHANSTEDGSLHASQTDEREQHRDEPGTPPITAAENAPGGRAPGEGFELWLDEDHQQSWRTSKAGAGGSSRPHYFGNEDEVGRHGISLTPTALAMADLASQPDDQEAEVTPETRSQAASGQELDTNKVSACAAVDGVETRRQDTEGDTEAGEWYWSSAEGWTAREVPSRRAHDEALIARGDTSSAATTDAVGQDATAADPATRRSESFSSKERDTVRHAMGTGSGNGDDVEAFCLHADVQFATDRSAADVEAVRHEDVGAWLNKEHHDGPMGVQRHPVEPEIFDRSRDDKRALVSWKGQDEYLDEHAAREHDRGAELLSTERVRDDGGDSSGWNEDNGVAPVAERNATELDDTADLMDAAAGDEYNGNADDFGYANDAGSEMPEAFTLNGPQTWSGVNGALRAANTWLSLVDRESGSTYFQNQTSGQTQWEPPEEPGAVVVPEFAYGDDASIG